SPVVALSGASPIAASWSIRGARAQRGAAALACSAKRSRGPKDDVLEAGTDLSMLEPLGHGAQRQRLCPGNSLVPCGAVRHGAREFKHLGNPPTIFFLLELDAEDHKGLIMSPR